VACERTRACGRSVIKLSRSPRGGADAGAPDLPTPLLAAAVTLVVAGILCAWRVSGLAETLGDTDDALRLVLARDLASGRTGWWDQHFLRLQPPVGMDLHWSRLVDGGIALLMQGFGLVLDPARAELAARIVWPLLWLVPAITAALMIARRLGGALAAFLCAIFLMFNLTLYAQFVPGRIDHHDVQIALCLLALAGAVRGGGKGGALAGMATGLGLAVGVEALVFDALIGAAIALRYLADPAEQRAQARAYAAALLATLPALFLIQTAPNRWAAPVCDALGPNLAGAVAVAAAGMLLLTARDGRSTFVARLAGLGAVAVAAGVVYGVSEPACLRGPLGQADPRLWPIWLSDIREMQSLFHGFPDPQNSFAFGQVIFHVLTAAAWLWLGRSAEKRSFAWGLLGAFLALGVAVETQAQRMSFYTAWAATPLLAAAVAEFGVLRLRARPVWMVLILLVVSPTTVSAAAMALPKDKPAPAAPKTKDKETSCSDPAAYRRLAALAPGVVLGEIDLGPYVLAMTPDSVIAAPYHRMSWGILAADRALSQPNGPDEAAVRGLGAQYVLDCAGHADTHRRKMMPPGALQLRLDKGQAPAWLESVSPAGEALQIYRVRPAPKT
jgi:hypothetical protein